MTGVHRVLVVAFALAAACACPPKKSPTIVPDGAGAGSAGSAAAANTCDGLKSKVEGLYTTEATEKEPTRVAGAAADNTAMVMGECAKAPDKVIPCLQQVTSVKDLEAQCMPQLSEDGSEADVLKP